MKQPIKSQMPIRRTVPHYVSRRTAATLLDLSLSGFGTWVKKGILPPPVAGSPQHEARWRWSEIEAWLAGDRSSAGRDLLGQTLPATMGHKRGPDPGCGGRPRKPIETL